MNKHPSSAIVVGGGSGIGRAAVLALAAAGTRVWAVGRDGGRIVQIRDFRYVPYLADEVLHGRAAFRADSNEGESA
jgi:NAD(P)-dependent dehydrogenase (short-subunit alcohol dehydrogenase family)